MDEASRTRRKPPVSLDLAARRDAAGLAAKAAAVNAVAEDGSEKLACDWHQELATSLQNALAAIPRVGTTQILNSGDRQPWTSDGFRTSFFRAVETAGVVDRTFHDLRGTAVTRLALADCTAEQIATITGHSLKEVHDIRDSHYLSRDVRLAEMAISKLEKARGGEGGTRPVKRGVKGPVRSGSEQA